MGCSPVRIAQERKGPVFTSDSEKLPRSVLDGFAVVLKTGVIIPKKTPKPIQLKPEPQKENPSINENAIDSSKTKDDPSEKPIEDHLERKETSREAVLSKNPVLLDEINQEANNEEPAKPVSRESPSSKEDLRQNTETAVIQGFGQAVIIEGFEGFN
jgi:hypothetical protein